MAYRHVATSPLHAALTAAAIVVMLRPASLGAVTALAALTVSTVAFELPNVFNHWFFTGMVSLALLAGCSVAWRRVSTPGAPGPVQPTEAFAPAARWSLILLYSLSGFHKLNHDFLDPAVSCATVLAGPLGARLAEAGPPLNGALPWLTLLTELGLPVLLLVPGLRPFGVATGSGFHLAMAAAGYPRFSAAGLALLTLFLPVGTARWEPRPGSAVARWSERVDHLLRRAWPLAALVGLAAAAFATALAERVLLSATVLLGLGLAIVALHSWRGGAGPAEGALRPHGGMWPAMSGPLLVGLAGLTPYVGLGTDRALAMYSNLRTEGGATNHLLVPPGLQLFSFQQDLMQVLGSDSPPLQALAEEGVLIPRQEFRARLTEAIGRAGGTVRVRYLDGQLDVDRRVTLPDAALVLPVPLWARKLLRFRAIERSGPRACGV